MISEHVETYKKYLRGLPSTAVSLEVNQPGWTIFEIENERVEITVSFRKSYSPKRCLDIEMPEAEYACSRLIIKNQ